MNLKAKLEEIIATNDVAMQRPNISTNFHQNESELHQFPS